ncbi:IS91 family transposase [Clostridium sp. YIM B02515]|uniref:IS91 family transposase n=1 Tax=Clostridium rhizosphaerae TaxID=2803861 RepID=A0ABS1TEH3_9CLOT|nr:IS91 family transposase [Clostridium rhizosphaerae]MBL4937745.1 IS91 family transposase [Clostridium rhizosphaerae]
MIEVQNIFQQFGSRYRQNHKLPLNQLKAMSSIEACRTSALGGHVDKCDECGHTRISYNSCRNRHCPKCQSLAREQWLENRKADLLSVAYFHVVFTLPSELSAIALRNQEVVYKILFRAVSETLLELALNPKYLGAQVGITALLHTWGQNLMFHPHIHCIVPSGGLSASGVRWINSKKKFFIPVRVLSKKFKGKFIAYLQNAYFSKELKFMGEIEELSKADVFLYVMEGLRQKDWVVYCKAPFKTAEYVLQYLGRYTHRVAISNNRIVSCENGFVTYKWRDYRDNKDKLMTVPSEEFIRRFLMHILPDKFVKIRHYGILGNRNRKTKLKDCKRLTNTKTTMSLERNKRLSVEELILKIWGKDISKCPCCEIGIMKRTASLRPTACSHPVKIKTS